ncbi:hypothetical protein [Streptomyces odontomachi]|uniref:hypothetical protein n=1 Tax=Streptomyces odontomachi TaxID=2944940 RepID=UPI0021098A7B|nr:hypothetical protein [Streptomyces sp. ODS25]
MTSTGSERARLAATILLTVVAVANFALIIRMIVIWLTLREGLGAAIFMGAVFLALSIAYGRWARGAWRGDSEAVERGGKLMFVPLMLFVFVVGTALKKAVPTGGAVPWIALGATALMVLLPAAVGIALMRLSHKVEPRS